MSRSVLVALVVSASLSLVVACGSKNEKNDKNEKDAEKSKKPTAGKTTKPANGNAKAPDKPGTTAAALGGVTGTDKGLKLSGDTDWKKLGEDAAKDPNADLAVDKKKGKVDPNKLSRAGIPKPIKGFSLVKATGLTVAYAPTTNPLYKRFEAALKKEQFFEKATAQMNAAFKFKSGIPVHITSCGKINAWWNPRQQRIIMCYELMGFFLKLFNGNVKNNEELAAATLGALYFVFYHEAGHMLDDVFDLPAVGKEEDAVDQLATLILLESGDAGVVTAMRGAQSFKLIGEMQAKRGKPSYWDEHSLGQQRFYNVACLIFGSNPSKYTPMVTNGYLPKKRAVRCANEYSELSRAWTSLLKPHLRPSNERHAPGSPPVATTTAPSAPGTVPGTVPGTAPSTPVAVPGAPHHPSTPPVAKPQPTATAGGTKLVQCKKVIRHLGMLLIKSLPKKQLSSAEQQNLRQQVTTFLQKVGMECMTKWAPATTKCVLRAQSLKQADGCG